MFKILDITKDDLIGFRASGRIEKEDYDKLNPILEKTEKEQDSIKLYLEIGELEGISFKALIKDIVTYFKHVKKVEKVAVTGKNGFEKGWVKVADPFIKADIKYFPVTEKDFAVTWILEGST
jgi:hypothetical protein